MTDKKRQAKSRILTILFYTGIVIAGRGVFGSILGDSIVSDPGERALWWFAITMIGIGLMAPYAFVNGMNWMMGIKNESK